MSETFKLLVACVGTILITLPFTIIGWKRADRDAAKLIERLTPPADVELTDDGMQWLRRQFTQRLRWTTLTTQLAICVTAPLVFGFRDVPVVGESGPVAHSAVAIFIGVTLGGTLALVRSARARAICRRSASLTPRTLRTYVPRRERWLYDAHVGVAAGAVVVTTTWWLRSAPDNGHATFYLALAVAWLLAVGAITALLRWVLRAPPVVDEASHVARELAMSLAIRALLLMQLQVVMVVAYVLMSYAYVRLDGFPWALSIAPLYAAGAMAAGLGLARLERRARGAPAAEWYFARTLEPTS